jgi:prophage tail gpP-like protein
VPAPAQFISDQIGALGDTIALVLNGERVVTAESWEHTESILAQPSAFSMRLGHGGVAMELFQRYPKGTPFELYIGGIRQGTGKVDAVSADQPEKGATQVTFRGRDALAKLHDTYIDAQVGIAVATYPDLVWVALQKCKLAPSGPILPGILRVDNVANRQLKAGVPIAAILPHRTVQQILDDAGLGGASAGVVHTTPLARTNETWLRFLSRYLDRAGLMVWASADGSFVLGAPNGNQPPTYTLVRRTGDVNRGANVLGMHHEDDATNRHTEAIVYGRGGGKALGRTKSKGAYVDQEMIDAGYDPQPLVFRDTHCHTDAEGAYYARRKIAEERRAGWRLEYRIAGLTLPYAGDGGNSRAVIIPDTIVSVHDEELGIDGPFYIETVVRSRTPATTTTIRLMRPEDLVFGGPQDDESVGGTGLTTTHRTVGQILGS